MTTTETDFGVNARFVRLNTRGLHSRYTRLHTSTPYRMLQHAGSLNGCAADAPAPAVALAGWDYEPSPWPTRPH